jgi:hypothetical protein
MFTIIFFFLSDTNRGRKIKYKKASPSQLQTGKKTKTKTRNGQTREARPWEYPATNPRCLLLVACEDNPRLLALLGKCFHFLLSTPENLNSTNETVTYPLVCHLESPSRPVTVKSWNKSAATICRYSGINSEETRDASFLKFNVNYSLWQTCKLEVVDWFDALRRQILLSCVTVLLFAFPAAHGARRF